MQVRIKTYRELATYSVSIKSTNKSKPHLPKLNLTPCSAIIRAKPLNNSLPSSELR
jgi:hypothetical protein